jgi:general secretion pathway protein G
MVELLIVIVILGVLAGVVVFAVGNSTQNASLVSCRAEASVFQHAVVAGAAVKPPVVIDGNKPQTDAAALQAAGLLNGSSLKYLANAAGGQAVEPGTYATGWTYSARRTSDANCG